MSSIKKILIVGSKGFIGSHAFSYFKSQNKKYKVWGCDVVVDYTLKNYFLIDSSTPDFKFIFEQEKFDYCINCSGAASVFDSLKNPGRDFQLNVVNVFKILDAIRFNNPTCAFLNLSSAAVYGNPTHLPISESSFLQPLSPYGNHKRIAEEICCEFQSHYNIKVCSLRIFSAYGEGLTKQLFWDLFQKSIIAKSGKHIIISGTGYESRDFIYIKDLVRCIEIILCNTPFRAETINVANGIEITIKDAVEMFYSLFPYPINFQFSGEVRAGDPTNWRADISLISAMGYRPLFSLKEGLINYYEWTKTIS